MNNRIIFLIIIFFSPIIILSQSGYNFSKIKHEKLGRGLVAFRTSESEVILTWRYLSSDKMNTSFNIYRNGKKIANVPKSSGTIFKDKYVSEDSALYEVRSVLNKKEIGHLDGKYTLPSNAPIGYLNIPLDKPNDGITPDGKRYFYMPNDASVGDCDGDGEFEIILKWDPSNSHDNSHDGYTGNVLLDCYKLNGDKLWRIDLGCNIRAGAHYTQFMVYDFDCDGISEIVMKTSDGTIDGKGQIIGYANADYRESGSTSNSANKDGNISKSDSKNNDKRSMPFVPKNQGRILTGNEYLTIFSGATGEALQTIDYYPGRGDISSWGDNRANRCDRFLAAVAYLDGVHPSVVMCRGYYTRTVLVAYDWDGKNLNRRWIFDSNNPGCDLYAGQGNHNLRIGDVDNDGCDEIVYGQCAIDNDGTGLYSTRMNHGDAMHLTRFSPDMDGMQVWACHENKKDGTSFRDAATGKVIFNIPCNEDVGRCMAADIDPNNKGLEMWSYSSGGIRNVKGEIVNPNINGMSVNMAVWWDGDLLRELLDKCVISKYDWKKKEVVPILKFDGCSFNNGTKSNPCLQGDIIGDWREEVLVRTTDNNSLRLYISPIITPYRFYSFLEDPVYRISLATENVAYNQPTQPGFYFGPDLKGTFRGYKLKK